MAQTEYDATPLELRKFALVQIGVTLAFCVLIFWLLGAVAEPFPPIWLVAVLLVPVGIAAFFSERVWMYGDPLNPADDYETQREHGVGVFAAQTVRKMIYCIVPIVICVLVAFVTGYGGWLVFTTAPFALAVMAFEVWPSLRNAAMTEVMLNSKGARSDILESFIAE